jgi:hypothetical protein
MTNSSNKISLEQWKKGVKKARDNKEHRMCKDIMEFVRLNERRYPCLRLLRHWPNEGRRNPKLARETGIISGVSDYVLPVPNGDHIGLWLEIKAPGKEPTEAQYEWLKDMSSMGHQAEWVDSVAAAQMIIETYARKATAWMNERNKQ